MSHTFKEQTHDRVAKLTPKHRPGSHGLASSGVVIGCVAEHFVVGVQESRRSQACSTHLYLQSPRLSEYAR